MIDVVGSCTHKEGEARICQQQKICGWLTEGSLMACVGGRGLV